MKTIEVPALARVEGEGGLYIGMDADQVVEVRLDIYEPPRFFEGFLVGRYFQEVPDITARICGICPVAYQMSSITALEKALEVEVNPQVYALRRLMYCAEFIQSHALHIYLLQAPDLLGQPSALELAAIAPEVVKKALRMKKIGNEILKAIGGRSVHPVNACVGGFHRWPDRDPILALLPELEWGLEAAEETVRWSVTLPFPEFEFDYEFVALHHPEEYAVMHGDAWSSKGYKTFVSDYEMRYFEEHVQHSNALHGRTSFGGTYLVGPLARLNLNHAQLHPRAQEAQKNAKVDLPLKNPYKSLVARAIELVHFFVEAKELIKDYQPEGPAHQNLTLKKGEGAGASEAPRGLLYHRYKIDEQGLIKVAKIVPPTAQNLPRIEADLFAMGPQLVKMDHERATLTAEHLIRAYDPCISCATHFLKLEISNRDQTIKDK
jgi:sulfhydrogenase subunit alpha